MDTEQIKKLIDSLGEAKESIEKTKKIRELTDKEQLFDSTIVVLFYLATDLMLEELIRSCGKKREEY